MNQFVPIFLGQQKPPWNPPRAADTQKCIRAGGKHNDLEDVGLDTYHHTFFEMLGNWTFGDYFKKEAIEWAWELVVERWKFPAAARFTPPFTNPGRAIRASSTRKRTIIGRDCFARPDSIPPIHIVNGNKKDNFWMMGDTGPCGPCSEFHVDLTPDGDTKGALVNDGDARCIEIWNLVFIQFNANPDGTFSPLPAGHVDTGMGFERVTAIIQSTKDFTDFSGTISNYETDIFRPIFDEIEKLSGKTIRLARLPKRQHWRQRAGENRRRLPRHRRPHPHAQLRHRRRHPARQHRPQLRPAPHPAPRRALRPHARFPRAVLLQARGRARPHHGRRLPRTAQETEHIEEIRREEEAFNKTLDNGIALFEREVPEAGSGPWGAHASSVHHPASCPDAPGAKYSKTPFTRTTIAPTAFIT